MVYYKLNERFMYVSQQTRTVQGTTMWLHLTNYLAIYFYVSSKTTPQSALLWLEFVGTYIRR